MQTILRIGCKRAMWHGASSEMPALCVIELCARNHVSSRLQNSASLAIHLGFARTKDERVKTRFVDDGHFLRAAGGVN